MAGRKDGHQCVMQVCSEEMKPKLVGHIDKIGARVCAVSAFWIQSMGSKQKIVQVQVTIVFTVLGHLKAPVCLGTVTST